MVDSILERIANKDGSLSVEQLIQEFINVRAELSGYKESHEKYCPSAARVRELEAALRRVRHAVDSHVPNCEFKDVIFEMIDQDLSAETACEHDWRITPTAMKCFHCGLERP